jgi:hypothetical protein
MAWKRRLQGSAATLGMLAGATLGFATPAQAANNDWQFVNNTSGPLWGEMHGQCGSDTANFNTTADHPINPGASINLTQRCSFGSNNYQWGRMCYRGHWWNLTRDRPYNAEVIAFQEKNLDSTPVLYAKTKPLNDTFNLVQTDAC